MFYTSIVDAILIEDLEYINKYLDHYTDYHIKDNNLLYHAKVTFN